MRRYLGAILAGVMMLAASPIQDRTYLKGQIVLVEVLDVDGTVIRTDPGPYPNVLLSVAETALRDCFGGTGTPTCTVVQAWKYHGIGTSSTTPSASDVGLTTELTTQYNPDNTRATGSQTNNGANVYRTVGTNTVDSAVTITEFGIFSNPTVGSGTGLNHALITAQSLLSGQALRTTYDLSF